MIEVAYTDIQPKIKINGLLFDSLQIQGFLHSCPLSMLLCIFAVDVLAIFIDADARIIDMQIGDLEIKIGNLTHDNTFVLLRDFNCLTKIELVLKLCEKSF